MLFILFKSVRRNADNAVRDHKRRKIAMLVLSRKHGERFQIGRDVRITIVKIDKHSVRIGIEAPGAVDVYREEIIPFESSFEDDSAPSARRWDAA